jgi:hypothetical protein
MTSGKISELWKKTLCTSVQWLIKIELIFRTENYSSYNHTINYNYLKRDNPVLIYFNGLNCPVVPFGN